MNLIWGRYSEFSGRRCYTVQNKETPSMMFDSRGRKGRKAKDLAFLEELKNNICYGMRKPLLNFDHDAARCYDRIIPSLASLIGRSKGLHYNITTTHAKTLKEAKFKLKSNPKQPKNEHKACF